LWVSRHRPLTVDYALKAQQEAFLLEMSSSSSESSSDSDSDSDGDSDDGDDGDGPAKHTGRDPNADEMVNGSPSGNVHSGHSPGGERCSTNVDKQADETSLAGGAHKVR